MCQTRPAASTAVAARLLPQACRSLRKHRQRQQHQAAGSAERSQVPDPHGGPRIVGGAMHQDRHREEQPHEIILPRQRRGHRHQAEQDAELLGIRLLGPTRRRRHHRDVAEPDQKRDRDHDQVRRLEARRRRHSSCAPACVRIVLIVVDRPRQSVRHRDDGLVDPGPVLLVALAKALLRARADHALVPGLQLRDIAAGSRATAPAPRTETRRGRRACLRRAAHCRRQTR